MAGVRARGLDLKCLHCRPERYVSSSITITQASGVGGSESMRSGGSREEIVWGKGEEAMQARLVWPEMHTPFVTAGGRKSHVGVAPLPS